MSSLNDMLNSKTPNTSMVRIIGIIIIGEKPKLL
jgi:hypothetical protein